MRLEELDVALVSRAAVAWNGVVRSCEHPQPHLGQVAGVNPEKVPLQHSKGHSGLTFCAVATTVPIAVLDPLLSSTESRRGPAYDLPVAKPVARDEVVQVAVPVNDYYAFRQLETAARTQDFVYHKAASATV